MRRDHQPAPAADSHADNPLVPALDHSTPAEGERQRVAPVPRAVELLPSREGDADVVGNHRVASCRLGSVAHDLVDDHQIRGRLAPGEIDLGLLSLGHGDPFRRQDRCAGLAEGCRGEAKTRGGQAGKAPRISTTKTRVSVPLIPAADAPAEPYPSAGGTTSSRRLPTLTPTSDSSQPGMV